MEAPEVVLRAAGNLDLTRIGRPSLLSAELLARAGRSLPLALILLGCLGGTAIGKAQSTAPAQSSAAAQPRSGPAVPSSPASASSAPASASSDTIAPQTHALLINGGGTASSNYLSHLHHLQDMVSALRARGVGADRIHVFSADGEDLAIDHAVRGGELPDFWLIDGTRVGRALDATDLTNTVWEGVKFRPARLHELRKWFSGMSGTLRAGDTLLLFVTDHGTMNPEDPDNGLISLWNESLSLLEFRALLAYLQPEVRVVSVMSQCYSGAFADAMAPLHASVPTGNVCGFFSTTSDRPAFGCYPEGRDRDRIGHAFRFIDAMGRHASLDAVHTAVLITDTTPDVPVRASDLFLERVLENEAVARRMKMEDLADEQLTLAWKERGRWEPQIRLLDRIGEVYGTFSPRSLGELKPMIERLESLSKELDTYERRWILALDDLRRENLDRFLELKPAWKERLDVSRLETLDTTAKKSTLAEVLTAIREFTEKRVEVQTRLGELRKTDEDTRNAKYRVDVRLAALMRMQSLLIRIAGIQLLSQPEALPVAASASGNPPRNQRRVFSADLAEAPQAGVPTRRASRGELKRALAGLEECEALRIGDFASGEEKSPTMESPEPLPPLEEDLAAVGRALPSWLGIQFRPVSDKQRDVVEVGRGSAMVEQVYPGSPASVAEMRVGDIVLGPPEGHFTEPNQIREWIMTSPREKPIPLDVMRDGNPHRVTVSLGSYPTRLPDLPAPPKAGDLAPRLDSFKMVRSGSKPPGADLPGRKHMIFFWATWCGPCKSSLPELMAWSRKTGVPILSVSDEDEETLSQFLGSWTGPFPELVASDEMRRSHMSYGVSGTPTFVLVDEHGKIEWRQVGYSPKTRLSIPGWSWPDPAPNQH